MDSDADVPTPIEAQDHGTNLAENVTVEDLTEGMAGHPQSGDDSTAPRNLDELPSAIKPRPYQLEMFKQSLERNIIVAVSCGLGLI